MKKIRWLKKLRHKFYIKLFKCMPIKKNKIIMFSHSFKSYSCNPKYITEYILQNNKAEYDIVWVFDGNLDMPPNIPDNIRVVKYFSIEYLYEIHTAKFIFSNTRTSENYYWNKRKNQIYIQTWHSSLRLKKIEKDAENFLPKEYIQGSILDSQKIDYVIAGCKFSSDFFKKSFWYSGKVLDIGTPRIDYLLNIDNHEKEKLREKIGLKSNCYIYLYAPTFRNDKSMNAYNIDYERLTKETEAKYNKKCVIMVKLHPNLINNKFELNLGDNVINMTNYGDIQELLVACDVLITDYSSCMFDAAFIKKPCFLYASDLDNYLSKERELYFDVRKLPFSLSENNQEFTDNIISFDVKTYENNIDDFLLGIGSFEKGKACEKILEIIKRGK